ncbi:hypothetical protein JL721_3781 [Aureococcus anophagefferens]|nr:hypothetical protein JL721_3781 [Aureococcus anophagefferens]
MQVVKRNGKKETVRYDKITSRIQKLCYGLDAKYIKPNQITQKTKKPAALISDETYATVQKHKDAINAAIVYERDFEYDYFGFKTLERSYLMRLDGAGRARTEGRPLDADLELWHGPDNTPCKMRVYVENGQLRPFSCVIATPRGPNTVAIRNIGQMEFPIAADVYANDVENPSAETAGSATTIQGGALRTYPFDPLGPNNNKQVIELYTEDGLDRPFFAILETPGSGNVVRIVNTAPAEFPMTAAVSSSGPLGLGPRESPKIAQGADSTILVQGGSLRTWSYKSPLVNQVQVVLSTEGRPLDADLELWHGPDNTPCKMRVYVENGQLRPFSCVIATPRGPNTVAIRNIGQMEFPIAADVYANDVENPSAETAGSATTIQGGALRTYPFDPLVNSVEVLLRTDGRPLNARRAPPGPEQQQAGHRAVHGGRLDRPFFAILETPGSGNVVRIVNTAPAEFPMTAAVGPNNNKQVIELYTEDGMDRPFFAILETPGSGNAARIVNTAPVEFPMTAGVVPHSIDDQMASGAFDGDVVIGGDIGW